MKRIGNKPNTERVILSVVLEQASCGARYVLQGQDGTIYFLTPGNKGIDKLTAEICAERWNSDE